MSEVFDPRDERSRAHDDGREARDGERRHRVAAADGLDPRDVFARELDLPRGPDRARVNGRDRDYTLNGAESRALATVGAFRVVPARDLRDDQGQVFDPRPLEDQGLVQGVPLNDGDRALTLTEQGRDLLECHRGRPLDDRQAFSASPDKPRERTHDAQIHRAYVHAAERLQAREADPSGGPRSGTEARLSTLSSGTQS